MYSVYNKKWNYVYLFTNRVASHTQRNFYIELHREEFTDDEYRILNNTTLFNKNLLYKFPKYETGNCSKIYLSRNPYHRASSIFSLYMSNLTNASPNIKEQSKHFFENNKDHSFLSFLKYINNNDILDSHILPQSLNYDKYKENIFIGKLSNSKNILYNFYKKIGFDIEKFEKVYNKTFNVKLNKSINKFDIKNLISEETENLIYKYYLEDFKLFGYKRYDFEENTTNYLL